MGKWLIPCRPSRRRRRGFTLIELLIVVAIIGIIAAISIGAVLFALQRARQQATVEEMANIAKALHIYYIDHDQYPDTGVDGTPGAILILEPLLEPNATTALRTTDHWGTNFIYDQTTTERFLLRSYGSDRAPSAGIDKSTRNDFTLDTIYDTNQFSNHPN